MYTLTPYLYVYSTSTDLLNIYVSTPHVCTLRFHFYFTFPLSTLPFLSGKKVETCSATGGRSYESTPPTLACIGWLWV